MINTYGEEEGLQHYQQLVYKQRIKKVGKKMKKPVWNKGIPATEDHKKHVSD